MKGRHLSVVIAAFVGALVLGVGAQQYYPPPATSVSGNAATATALQTARAINGVSFDGTSAITVPAAAGTLTGATLASNILASSLTSVGTLTGLTATAGGGSATAHPGGTLLWVNDAIANAADTNWVITTVYALPAGTLAVNGDRLDIEAVIAFSSFVSTKSYACNIGHTSFSGASGFTGGINLVSATTSATSDTFVVRPEITRQSATTGGSYVHIIDLAGAVKASSYSTGTAITWANGQNVACAVKDSIGTAAAGAETIHEFRVVFAPR